ncbi:MAG: DUF4118 domain-containing protein [Clostridium sp.]
MLGENKLFNKKTLFNLINVIVIIFLCTAISLVFNKFGIREENIVMMYIIGVILVIIQTKKYIWVIISSIICIFVFNFFFTYPKLTFMVDDSNYIVTFVMFLTVAGITSILSSKLQRQAKIAKENENQSKNMYELSRSYLNISGVENIAYHTIKSIYSVQKNKSIIYLTSNSKNVPKPYYIKEHYIDKSIIENDTIVKCCFDKKVPCGAGTIYYPNSKWSYMPINSNNKVLGVICIDGNNEDISTEKSIFIKTAISQMALAVEREFLYLQQEQNRIEIEKEKLRSNLLRSISHDLRTPLTSIAGASSFIIESYDGIDRATIMNLLENISNDAVWLNKLVDNLLNMTRIQDGKLIIKEEKEVVDDIVTEAYRRVVRIQKDHKINIKMPDDIILVPMDGKLIIQVIINLLDNAIKHTNSDSDILLNVYREGDFVVFEVSDNGGGIKEELIDKVFESFVGNGTSSGDAFRGIGLGLSICKSIIEAHNGTITAYNNEKCGATFRFTLPLKGDEYINA